jgi:hypothetical protein
MGTDKGRLARAVALRGSIAVKGLWLRDKGALAGRRFQKS